MPTPSPLPQPDLLAWQRETYRRSLHAFVRDAWPHVESRAFVDGRHIAAICDALTEHTDATGDLVINVPPGMSKSWICSVLWPAWIWATRDPGHRFICTSYADTNVRRDAIRMRNLVQSDWWRSKWPHIEIPFQNTHSAADWTTTQGGGRISVPAGGQIVGRHGDTIIVDDPIKPVDAHHDRAELATIQTWWDETVPPRVLPGGRRVIVMQRLHDLDLSGVAISRGAKSVVLPMRFESARADPRDWRRVEGELLAPAYMDAAAVEARESAMSPYAIAGQEQQRPAPEGGGIFQREWLAHRWTRRPMANEGEWVQSWDCAFKGKDSSDPVCGGVWCKRDGFYDLVRRVWGRLTFTETVAAIRETARLYPQAKQILVEDAANGAAVVDSLRASINGLTLVPPRGGKVARAHAVTHLFAAGQVRLPPGEAWVEDFVAELSTFPAGAHDDMVDSTSQALAWLALREQSYADRLPRLVGALRSAAR